MELIGQGLLEAVRLLLAGDREVWSVTWLSLRISATATLLALACGIPLGTVLALSRFTGRGLLISVVNTGMGLPPVVVGLFVTIVLWRSGVLGFLELLYTPTAMVLAQLVIAAPIVIGLTLAAIQQIPDKFRLQLLALGASRPQMVWTLLKEARLPMLAAVMAGFGAVISEVGASLMVGGNIKGSTRVLTTATVLETSKGNFDIAIALSLILLVLMFLGPIGWAGKPTRLPTWKGAPASVEPRASLRPLAVGQGIHRRYRTQCRYRHPARVHDGAAALLGPRRCRRARDATARAASHGDRLLPHPPPRTPGGAGGAALRGHGLERGVHVVRRRDRRHRDGAAPPREDGTRRHRVRRPESGTRRLHSG